MPAGLRVFDASGVELVGITTSLIRILGDNTATYNKAPISPGSTTYVYTGSVQSDGLKIGTAWWFIYTVRYQEDTAGDETDLSRVDVVVDRSAGTLSWTAYGYEEVFTLEIRVVFGAR